MFKFFTDLKKREKIFMSSLKSVYFNWDKNWGEDEEED